MKRYVGVYALPDGRTLDRQVPRPPDAAAMLQAQVTGFPPVPLLQNGKDRFYNPAVRYRRDLRRRGPDPGRRTARRCGSSGEAAP